MGLKMACKDLGVDCPYIAQGETEEQLMTDVAAHAKTVHGYTDEKLNDPKTKAAVKAAIKKE